MAMLIPQRERNAFNVVLVSVSTMTYCVVQINCLPLPRFLKEVTMKTAEERYEETWNSYLELLNKDPRARKFNIELQFSGR